mgnify:FL=1
MARINLVPWREQSRKRRKKVFILQLVAGVTMAVLFTAGWHLLNRGMIDNQLERNALLRKELMVVDARLAEIRRLDEIRDRLVARMEQIRSLQSSRPESVHLMDELAFMMPQGVVLSSVRQKGRSVSLEGVAQSNAQISALMDNVDDSAWLTKPELKLISTAQGVGDGLSHFSLAMQQQGRKEEGP